VKIFIGIDDTDNLDTRGTGYQARSLGISLTESGLFQVQTITRHQLLVDPQIPYTSHNSSACLAGETSTETSELAAHCIEFLIRESAFDSDAGLCIVAESELDQEIIGFGRRAKKEVLKVEDTESITRRHKIFLKGLLNTRIGIIGALAAVGLRSWGNDGRLLWIPNLRETTGIFTVKDYLQRVAVDRITELNGKLLPQDTLINITEWSRPVMKHGQVTLIVEKIENDDKYTHRSAAKEYIKSISE